MFFHLLFPSRKHATAAERVKTFGPSHITSHQPHPSPVLVTNVKTVASVELYILNGNVTSRSRPFLLAGSPITNLQADADADADAACFETWRPTPTPTLSRLTLESRATSKSAGLWRCTLDSASEVCPVAVSERPAFSMFVCPGWSFRIPVQLPRQAPPLLFQLHGGQQPY